MGSGHVRWGDGLLSLKAGGPRLDWFPVQAKTLHSQHPHWFWIVTLNKGGPPIELPSIWGHGCKQKSPNVTFWETLSFSLGQFMQTPDTGPNTKEEWTDYLHVRGGNEGFWLRECIGGQDGGCYSRHLHRLRTDDDCHSVSTDASYW